MSEETEPSEDAYSMLMPQVINVGMTVIAMMVYGACLVCHPRLLSSLCKHGYPKDSAHDFLESTTKMTANRGPQKSQSTWSS